MAIASCTGKAVRQLPLSRKKSSAISSNNAPSLSSFTLPRHSISAILSSGKYLSAARGDVTARVAYADHPTSPSDNEDRVQSSTLTSTSRSGPGGVGQSCLNAYYEAMRLCRCRGASEVSQDCLLLALLRDEHLIAVVDQLQHMSLVVRASQHAGAGSDSNTDSHVNFGKDVLEVLQAAVRLSRQLGAASVESEHVLASLLQSPSQQVSDLLADAGLTSEQVHQQLMSNLQQFSQPQAFSSAAYSVLSSALLRSPNPEKGLVTTLQLFVGISQSTSAASEVLQAHGATSASVSQYLDQIMHDAMGPAQSSRFLYSQALQADGTVVLHRLQCTPQAKIALQLALKSASSRGRHQITSLDLLYGVLKAHSDTEQNWCQSVLRSAGANLHTVLQEVIFQAQSEPLSPAEQREIAAPVETHLLLPAHAWN